MTIEEVRGYKQLRTPDYARLANLVTQAKGSERTMAQFAEATQIGASTLSRLVNHNIKKPLAVETIIRIYENRANEDDTYLLDSLAHANGLYPAEYAERIRIHSSTEARRNAEINRKNQMKNALIAGVVAAGAKVSVPNFPRVNTKEASALLPLRFGDFMLHMEGETFSGIVDWGFILNGHIVDDTENDSPLNEKFYVRWTLEKYSRCFLIDAWSPETLKGVKISFAFVDRKILDEFWNAIRIAKVNNEMSLILLDPGSYKILDEIWIPGSYNQLSNVSIFQAPVPIKEDLDEEASDDYYNNEEDTE